MEQEIWKSIEGYEGLYEVSNQGRVKSLDRWYDKNHHYYEKILSQNKDLNGYKIVDLSKNGKSSTKTVHRLVAKAFIPNPLNLYTVNHKDEDKTNNNVENLEWMSLYDNNRYGTHDERVSLSKGKKIIQYSLNKEYIQEYNSAHEVNRKLGFDYSNICACCKGRKKTAYGYIWKYE